MIYTYISSLKINNHVILKAYGVYYYSLFINMDEKLDITAFIYIIMMVVVFALGVL